MPHHELRTERLGKDEDWAGRAAAFKCPHCHEVFLVNARVHRDGRRRCPNPDCGRSTGFVEGAREANGNAWIEW